MEVYMFPMPPVLAGVFTSLSNWSSNSATRSWDSMWDLVFSGGIYRITSDIGVMIALMCLMVFIVKLVHDFIHKESPPTMVLSEFVFPVIVVVLLTNNGHLMGELTKGLRTGINSYNTQILNSVSAQIDFEETLSQLSDYSSASSQISMLRSQCNTLLPGETLQECLKVQNGTAENMLAQYRREHGNGVNSGAWINSLERSIGLNNFDPSMPLQSLQGWAQSLVGVPILVETILIALQYAFQQLLEVSMLVTGMIGPIAVGASILPFGAKPLYAWLTGFLSLGMCKLCFNLLVGLYAVAAAKTGPTDTLPTAIILGLLSPILAMAMATGGGMAVFNGLLSAASAAASMTVGTATQFILRR